MSANSPESISSVLLVDSLRALNASYRTVTFTVLVSVLRQKAEVWRPVGGWELVMVRRKQNEPPNQPN